MAKDYSRTQRIGDQMQRELAQLIQREIKDPRLGLVTITGVEVSRDVAHAKVFITVMGQDDAGKIALNMEILNDAAGYLRMLLHNASVLNLLRQWGHDEEQVRQWIGHWVGQGLAAVEQLIGDQGWCFGDRPGLADVYLVPQLYAAERFGVALDAWPRIRRVADLAAAHPAFRQAHPANQPDTPAA